MKWIKTAIGAVIGISVIPLLVLSVINIKKSLETEKITITTELEYFMDYGDYYEFFLTIHFDELIDYYEKGFTITNLYDYTNDITITITNWYFFNPEYLVISDNNSVNYDFYDNSVLIYKTYESIYNVDATNIVLMDITLTKTNVNLAAILISFVPIIFVGGVVLFYYKPFKKD
ncbi:MAG TPA: hypothetical protein VIK77_05880 [Tissierellaceae bacterium]